MTELTFYSTKDVKERLRIKSTQTLKKYRTEHGFPDPIKSGLGQTDRYSVADVHAWEKAQLVNAA